MSRLIVIFILCAAAALLVRAVRRKSQKNKAQDKRMKPASRLVQDPETGEYHIKVEDEE